MSLPGGEEAAAQPASGLAVEAETEPRAKTTSQPGAADYIISPDDLLEVNVFDVGEFSRMYRVSPSGFITMPLVPAPIAAAGLTTAQLAVSIRDGLQADGLVPQSPGDGGSEGVAVHFVPAHLLTRYVGGRAHRHARSSEVKVD